MSLGLQLLRGTVAPGTLRPLEVVERATTNMLRLLEDLVDVAAIEKGVLSVDPVLVEARALMDDARAQLAYSVENKRLTLDWRSCEPDFEVWADRQRVLQVLGNLVGNAVKFTPPGGRIAVATTASEDEVVISVEDTGPGIPAEDHARLFDRFFRGSRPSGHGAGLGLAIARALVHAHGGRLWVNSELGRGTTFSFTLRRCPPSHTAVQEQL
jgi:signal transduction histidine kinase